MTSKPQSEPEFTWQDIDSDSRMVFRSLDDMTSFLNWRSGRLEEQLEVVTRVAEAAKTYRDVRGDYAWVRMIQALDAWENPNPASESKP